MFYYYDKFKNEKLFENKPDFTNDIEEVCSEIRKKEIEALKRDRSMTYSMQTPKNKFDDPNLQFNKIKIPRTNRIIYKVNVF